MRKIKHVFAALVSSLISSAAVAALPAQFSECLADNSSTTTSFNDLKDMAKVAKMTYCQNQPSLVGSTELKELLKSNVDVGISLSKSTYSLRDFQDMAAAGSYVLYVDGTRLNRLELATLAQAGVQLVVMASSSGMSQVDLMALAGVKSFIYNVDSLIARSNLQALVESNVQVVIRTSSTLSKADIVAVAQANNSLVTVMP